MAILNTKKKNTHQGCEALACQTANEAARRSIRPPYSIRETETEFQVDVDLPGVAKSGLEILVQDGVLEVTGNRAWSLPEAWRPLGEASSEYPSYRLRLSIEDEVNETAIKAKLENGMLVLILPKKEETKPRRIAIK